MEKEQQQTAQSAGLIYGLNDRPPLKDSIFAALQHLLAIFVAIITPPLIIAGALKLDLETTGFLVSMALFASGISTFIQCRRVGPIGCGLLCIQGTSFSFIGPIISAGLTGGLSAIFGACIVASSVEMLISRVLKYTRRVITPLVSGIVVTLIGMSLIKVGISACGGGAAAQADGTFGAFRHIGLAALVLVLIIFFNRSSNRYLRMSSIVIGLVVGYVLAWALGMVDFSAVQSYGGFNIPIPFRYGISFDISAIIALALVYLITAIEAYGDITANSLISGNVILIPKGINFGGYKYVLEYEDLWNGYKNTILYTLGHTAIATFVTILTGFALSRKTLPGRRAIMFFMGFTMYFNGGMVPTYLIYKSYGFTGNPYLYILIGALSVYNVIITRTFMESNVPDALWEAASIDGSNYTRFFFRIAIPLSPAIIAILVLFYAVGQWNSWFNAMLYLKNEQRPLQNVLRTVLNSTNLANSMDMSSSQGDSNINETLLMLQCVKYCIIIVSTLPIMCLYPFVQKYFLKGIMVGAIKG